MITVNREYFVPKIVFESCNNFLCYIIFGQTTLYCILLLLAMYFCAFNFRTSQAVQKYLNDEIFMIYGTCIIICTRTTIDIMIDNVYYDIVIILQ